jgi:Chaperone of endosialidase
LEGTDIGGGDDPPAAPDPAKLYQGGIDVFLKNLPRLLETEELYRTHYDPRSIERQQDLQERYGPKQYEQQLDALKQLDPQSFGIRQQLADRVSADLASGYELSPEYETELTSQIRGAQSARGNILGTGAAGAESAFKGKAALDMYQQRLQNAGAFLSGPTPQQQLLTVQGVSPDRSMAYASPSAGTAGVNAGLANYQNILAQHQLSGGGTNPWASAAGGAATGASAGAAFGPWGAVIGGLAGGAAGYFSDVKVKQRIRTVGETPSGIPLVEFEYRDDPEHKTYRGVIAQDVLAFNPEAVTEDENGFLKVRYDLIDTPFDAPVCLG